jgi:hypothetical protein
VFAALDTTTLCGWVPAIVRFNGYDKDSAFDAVLLNLIEGRCFDPLADAASGASFSVGVGSS